MGWVNNVITVQALPQDRHISWPTHPFSLSAIQPLLHPVFCPPIFIPLATGHPSLLPVCVRRSPGYTLVAVCQDTSPSSPTIVSIDACATRLYARANLPCTDRRSSINSFVQHTDETSRRNVVSRAFGKMMALYRFRELFFAMFLFFPISLFLPSLHRVAFFARNIAVLVPISYSLDSNNGRSVTNDWRTGRLC